MDSQKPEESIVFTRNYFGGNGQGPSNCIQTGPYANFPLTVPDRHCLQRKFNGNSTLGVFSAPEVLSLLVSRTPDFFTFAKTFEATPHAAPHVNIGGDMSTMRSPNDPLFYLHHSFCDKLWLSFQQKGPNFKMQFNSPTNSSVNLDTPLLPFGIPVRSVMDTDALCYRYQEPSFRRRSTVNRPVPRDLTCHLVKAQESPKSFDYFQISPVISNSPIIEKIDCFLSALPSLPHTELNTTRLNAVLQQNPGPFDRTVENVAKLHLPNFIDTHWLHHMRLQECDIRKVEAFLMEITGDLNDLSGFTSIANME